MHKTKLVSYLIFSILLTIIFAGCGGGKVTDYEQARIISTAWNGDTLVAYSKKIERGFVVDGIRRNARLTVELWLAVVNPQNGEIDTTFGVREFPSDMERIEFYPGGNMLLYAESDGVYSFDLKSGERKDFFTHPSIKNNAEEIDVGPGEGYVAIVVDADVTPSSEGSMDLFMVDISNMSMVFHTGSLVDPQGFAWFSEGCIAFITPDPWDSEINRVMQFGVSDNIEKPSDMTEEEVRKNFPDPRISSSGRWEAVDEGGVLAVINISGR